ncbi:MAG: beta-galactosidase trimerization domain-containing protein, partial [Acidobacteria bacterium]|nr:beta-galactosidase trimerization domain-containing protein [Acidobacteriota bacterium]
VFIGGDLTKVPLWKPGLTARMLETQAGGKPTIIFSAASHKPWTFSLLPGAELKLLYADTIANAAGVWMGITPFEFEEPDMQSLAQMNGFLKKNVSYFQGTRSEAKVGVVWSDVTANFYAGASAQLIDIDRTAQRSQIGNLDGEFAGITESLLRAQVPFDVLDDVSLEKEPLGRYQAIFLPNVACMSDRVAARLREYAEKGGNLFADFETSLYDETGLRRTNFALAGLFGVSATNKLMGPRQWDFLRPAAEHRLLGGVTRKFIPSPAYYVQAKADSGSVLLKYTEQLAGRYDGVPKLSDDPGLVVNRVGKGTVVYMSGDLGNTINTFHTPEFMQLVANAGTMLGATQVKVENVPGTVEVVVRSQQGGRRTLIHLVNFTGEMTRPIRRVLPVRNAKLTLAKGLAASKARALWSGKDLPLSKDAQGRVSLTVPRMDEYEVVVVE